VSYRRARCRARITELVRDLPEGATLEQRRKALWGKGEPAHEGTAWGRRCWGQEVRAYLGRHGDATAKHTRRTFEFPDHVHFPFQGESDA
jgi:hypothetical protein